MTLLFKTQYLEAIKARYYNSTKKGKSQILDELCKVTGYSRKHAIRVLAEGHMTGKKNSGRTIAYSQEARYHLKRLWHLMGRICSKKMVAAFPMWLEYYQRADFTPLIKEELLSMSSSSIDRYLSSYKKQFVRMRRSGTRRSKKFNNIIPIKNFDHLASRPGYIQADTVAHCGTSLSGIFMWSMTITDEFTGWTENRVTYGKGANNSLEAIVSAFSSLPFKPISFNSDNGSEFINKELHNYIARDSKIDFTRSRPYRKNDNAHVEQKNFTHVRELFGYERFDFKELELSMNNIYKNYFNILHNFFIPQQKLISKVRVGSRYIKKYDTPKTPYQRVMESKDIAKEKKLELKSKFDSFNPLLLKKELNQKMIEFKREHQSFKKKKRLLAEYYEKRSTKQSKAA